MRLKYRKSSLPGAFKKHVYPAKMNCIGSLMSNDSDQALYLSIATMSFLGAVFGLILYKIYRKKSIDIEGVGRWIIV
jgi:hypothetical protein